MAEHIAIFLPSLRGGGAERSTLKLTRGLVEQGFRVDLLLAQAVGPYWNEVPEGVRVVDLKAKRILASVPSIARYLRKEQPRALLSVMYHANFVALWARKLINSKTRVVINEQNTLSQTVSYNARKRVKLVPQLARHFYRWADAITGVSVGVAEDLKQLTGLSDERIKVVHNPIITQELPPKVQAPLDHPWFKPGEPPVVIGVGRMVPQKDFPNLISAFAQVRERRPARLLILGEGELRPQLEEQVSYLNLQKDVLLPGFVNNPYPYMAKAGVFVLSSRYEGLPTVLVEAMYCGVPLVATDCPSGPREILAGGAYGQLVPMMDPTALAQAIERTLDGSAPKPPLESWRAYELGTIVQQYSKLFLA